MGEIPFFVQEQQEPHICTSSHGDKLTFHVNSLTPLS